MSKLWNLGGQTKRKKIKERITRLSIKPDPNKVQGIMDLVRPAITTEVRANIVMVQYYKYMCTRRSHVLASLKESSSGPKDGIFFGSTRQKVPLRD